MGLAVSKPAKGVVCREAWADNAQLQAQEKVEDLAEDADEITPGNVDRENPVVDVPTTLNIPHTINAPVTLPPLDEKRLQAHRPRQQLVQEATNETSQCGGLDGRPAADTQRSTAASDGKADMMYTQKQRPLTWKPDMSSFKSKARRKSTSMFVQKIAAGEILQKALACDPPRKCDPPPRCVPPGKNQPPKCDPPPRCAPPERAKWKPLGHAVHATAILKNEVG